MFYFFLIFVINIGLIAFLIYSVVQKIRRRPNQLFQLPSIRSPAWFGISIGLRLSLCLSITYGFLGVFIIETFVEPGSQIFLFMWLLGSPIIFIAAIVPSVICGTLTGFLLSELASLIRKRISITIFVVSGIALCTMIVVFFHVAFHVHVALSFVNTSSSESSFGIYESYPFSLGIPSIIYLLTGGWASWYIYKRLESDPIVS